MFAGNWWGQCTPTEGVPKVDRQMGPVALGSLRTAKAGWRVIGLPSAGKPLGRSSCQEMGFCEAPHAGSIRPSPLWANNHPYRPSAACWWAAFHLAPKTPEGGYFSCYCLLSMTYLPILKNAYLALYSYGLNPSEGTPIRRESRGVPARKATSRFFADRNLFLTC